MKNRFLHPVTKGSPRDVTTAAAIVSILLAAVGILSTYLYIHSTQSEQATKYQQIKQQQYRASANYINGKLANYSQILLSGATAVNVKGSEAISGNDWATFFKTSRVATAFPEILGVGYATYIPSGALDSHVEAVRSEGFPDYRITPVGERSEYTAITYIEPFDDVNRKAFGYDMFTEPTRRQAMTAARDKASFGLTGPVVLKQDDGSTAKERPKSVLLYYPVYRAALVPELIEDRRQNLVGYVYLAFRIQDMMAEKNIELSKLGISYELTDATGTIPAPLSNYQVPGGKNSKGDDLSGKLKSSNRMWQLTLHVPKTLLGSSAGTVTMFVGGVSASILLGGLVFTLLKLRIGQVKSQHDLELQRTRDELLALASHQLRTPASSVRQYIGMLEQGYFGELNKEQAAVAHKAYQSNDRQLEIIDQLLYVAKADANQLIVQPSSFNLAGATRDIIDSMAQTYQAKSITVKKTIPKELPVLADERFVRMIIENLLSNAVKYSFEKGSIHVKLTEQDNLAQLVVSDSGVGIAESDYEKLFKKFSRIPNELSTKEGGSGLGLYLARRFALAHGGDITVQSNGQHGTGFTLTLPIYTKTEHNVIQLTE